MQRCALVTMAFLAGCASPEIITATHVTLPDGRAGHHVDCSQGPRGHLDCLVKASALCPLGYFALNIETTEMTIRCKTLASD